MDNANPPINWKTELKRLQGINFSGAQGNLWVVHRQPRPDKTMAYRVRRIKTEEKLERKLIGILRRRIEGANHVEPYTFESTDQDERVLVHDVEGTEFPLIAQQILMGTEATVIDHVEDLNNAFATIITVAFGKDQEILFGFRKLQAAWRLKKVTSLINFIFKDNVAVAVDTEAVLRIEDAVDFIAFREHLLILNKRQFEQGLNYRRGMEAKRDQLFDSFKTLGLIKDPQPLVEKCGNNLHYLRKLASIEKSGYYRDSGFMEALKKKAKRYKWPIEFVDGQLVMSEDNLDLIITLLNNNRVGSLINSERFDVEGTKKPI